MSNQRLCLSVMAPLLALFTGCAGLHPLDGIPVDCLAPELNQAYRSCQQTIDLSLLRQTPPKDYRVDSGDVLAVYVQGVLGGVDRTETPPTHFQQSLQFNSSAGFPIHVRSDGTVSLPLVKPVNVRGLTIAEVEDRLRKAYTEDGKILQPGREMILVSLQQPRTIRVLVLRDERVSPRHHSNTTFGPDAETESGRRGQVVDLPAYDNDVLHALTKTGGLPSLDAENAVYIVRRQGEASLANPPAPQAFHQPAWLNATKTKNLSRGMVSAPSPSKIGFETEKQKGFWQRLRKSDNSAASRATANDEWWKETDPSIRGRMREFWSVAAIKRQGSAVKRGDEAWWADHRDDSRNEVTTASTASAAGGWSDDSNGEMREPPGGPVGTGTPRPPLALQNAEGQELVGPVTEYTDGATIHNPRVTRIPIRITPGEVPAFGEQDIVLHDGDVIYIEPREQEFFYTSGLLGGGQYAIPRDYDLDVLGALSIVQSQVNTHHHGSARNVGGMSVLNQDVSVGASELIIRRKMPDHSILHVKVDLKEAVRSPQNRVFVQPGDYLILQYTRCEACAAFAQRYLLEPFVIGSSSGAFFGGN